MSIHVRITYTINVHDVTISINYQLCSVFELCHSVKFCIDFLKMENEIRRITSERGNDLLLVNGHKFRCIRQRADGYVRWRCCKKQCTSTVLMTIDDLIIENASEHNHPVDPIQKIDRQVLRESCKRKATSNISTRPIKLIRNELMNSVSTELEHKDLKSVRKAMYIERRKNLPPYPTSSEDAITKINEFQDADFLMFRGKKFVHLPDDSTFICLTTEENLQCLTSCTDVFTDGTFEYAPKFFLQLYTIHGYKKGIYVPLVYFFLKDKFKNTYINVWKYLISICEKQSLILKIKILHIDFEIGAIEAVKEVFPAVQIKTCRFHLGQAWWRKVS